MSFKLDSSNYHSKEANMQYMSSTLYKDFAGMFGRPKCEAHGLAVLKGEWEDETTEAMKIGSYVDAHFSGTLDVFKAQNPEIFTKSGELKVGYKHAEVMIQRVERDPLFMKSMSGEKQVIITAEIFGIEWKACIDSLIYEVALTDLKTAQAIRKAYRVKDYGYVSFIEYWGYDIQMAIYQKIVEIKTGHQLPVFISVVSKEKPEPDHEVIHIDQNRLDESMIEVETNLKRILQIKNGEAEPDRCGRCDYCKHTKILTKPIHYSELILDFS